MNLVRLLMPVAWLFFSYTNLAVAYDEEAAKTFAEENKCFKCHAVEKIKDGGAYRDIAAKYAEKFKGKPYSEAEARAIEHLTSGEMVKFPDGHEEKHKKVKSEDMDAVKNLIGWILSLPGGTYKSE